VSECKVSQKTIHIDILSLFPNYFHGPFDESIVGRAKRKGIVDIKLHNIRDFTKAADGRVDDRPYGGGPGMVMQPQPVEDAIMHVHRPDAWVIYLTPQGERLTASLCRSLAQKQHLILLCGHYEGIDQRVLDRHVQQEISIGDYVLTNGGLAAIVLVDAVLRFVPNVLGHELSAAEDSFEQHCFDCPQYTRPENFKGAHVPAVLLSGDHQKIAAWRKQEALKKTAKVRPDLCNIL